MQVYTVDQIIDIGINIATKLKALNLSINAFNGRVTTLEQTDTDTNLRLTALESNAGGGSSLTMQEVRDEIYHWGVYRDVYVGTGWYKDANGRVYSKGVASGETKTFPNDPNTYVNLLDSDLTWNILKGLSGFVPATSNISSLQYLNLMGDKVPLLNIFSNKDVSSWDVGHITDFERAFAGARNLSGADKLDTSSAVSANYMFSDSTSAQPIDISKLDFRNLVTATKMFYGAGSLKGLDDFYAPKIVDMGGMFERAQITSDSAFVDLSKWAVMVSNVTNMNNFMREASLGGKIFKGLNDWRVDKVTNMDFAFDTANVELDPAMTLVGWRVGNISNAPVRFFGQLAQSKRPIWGTNPYSGYGWHKDSLTGVVYCNEVPNGETHKFDGDPKTYVCYHAKTDAVADPTNAATSNIKDMMGIFINRKDIAGLDLSHWDVSNATDMNLAFRTSNFDGDLSNWRATKITYKPNGFLAGTPIENDLSKHPRWGA